jgi:hypothetical protein
MVPVGNTAQRPSSPVAGMQRFNTTLSDLEFYDGTAWFGTKFQFTLIRADSFIGDGSTVTFVLSEDTTTAACMISINGVVQIPTDAYSVTGNVLTFTEPPDTADQIDARILSTTAIVTSLENTPGNASVILDPTVANIAITAADTTVSGNLDIGGSVTGKFVIDTMTFEKDSDVTGTGNVTFNTTPVVSQGTSFGTMDAGGIFTFSSDGVFQVNVAYHVSADPDAYGGINGFGAMRYNQASGSQLKNSVTDVISVSATDTYTWAVNNAVTVYGTGNTNTRIQFMRIG